MQARARLQNLLGTAGFILAVPSFLSAAQLADGYSEGSVAPQGVIRGPLAVAAAQRLAPDFNWVDVEALNAAPSLNPLSMALSDLLVVPVANGRDWAIYARAAMLAKRADTTLKLSAIDPTVGALNDSALDRRMLTSGLYLQSSGGVGFGVDAVFADQRFASATLPPLVDIPGRMLPENVASSEESRGIGLAMSIGGPIEENFGWSLGLRSRVDMDTYKRFRGVYSEPGDLDIPATAAVGLSASLAPQTALVLGAEHVFYSDINGFSSYALPNRFLALLGDSSSPSFEWQDLTVYSAALQGAVSRWQWSVRYSTSLQPNPTAGLLQQAIEGIQSDSNWSLGVGRALGGFGDFRLTASYAGSEYVLGSPYVSNIDPTESTHFEFEALWNVRF